MKKLFLVALLSILSTGFAQAKICPAGQYSDGLFNAFCDPCPIGTYSERGSKSPNDCKPCGPGKIPAPDKGGCQVCPEGTYQPAEKGTKCIDCPSGKISSVGASSCSLSILNAKVFAAVSTMSNSVNLAKCSAGTYGDGGRTPCSPCPSGSFSEDGASVCVDCQTSYPGFTSSGGGNASSCNIKLYCQGSSEYSIPQNATSMTEILAGRCFAKIPTACVQGYKIQGTGQYTECVSTAATSCEAGRILVNGSCQECQGGTYSAGGTVSVCSECPDGSYSTPRAAKCEACPAGYISDGTKTGCIKPTCGQGQKLVGTKCENCPDGYSSDGTTCYPTKCAVGQKLTGTGISAKCETCPDGQTSDGKTCYAKNCSVGEKLTGAGSNTKCEKCAANQTSDGKTCYPTKCNVGQKLTGKDTASKCEACKKDESSDGVTCYPTKCDNKDYELVNAGTINAKCEKKTCGAGQVLSGGKCVCSGGKKSNPNSKDDKCFTEKIPYNASNTKVVKDWDYIEAGDVLYKVPKSCQQNNVLCQQINGEWQAVTLYSPNEHSKCDSSCNKTTATATISAPSTVQSTGMSTSKGMSGKVSPGAAATAKPVTSTRGGTVTPVKTTTTPTKSIPNRK